MTSSKKRDYSKLWELFKITLMLGATTFGGGYAMFPLMEKEYVEKKGWFETKDMLDMLAVSQSLPGMISVNATLMVGYRLCGVVGALIALVGLVFPSLIALSIISFFYVSFSSNKWVVAALSGVRVGVIGLLIQAVIKLGKPAIKDLFSWILAIATFLLAIFSGIHPVFIIIAGAVIGILYSNLKKAKEDVKL